MVNRTVRKSYWNQSLLDFIINQLSVAQLPFISKNLSAETVAPTTLVHEAFSTERIPYHFLDKLSKSGKVSSECLENLYIFKVNTKDSLLHSLLGLLDSNYQIASWERKEYLVGLFRSKLYYDIDKSPALLHKLKKARLSRASVQRELQEKFPSDVLKRFISVYFNINMIIVTNRSIEYVPSGKDFDQLRPALLFYQYPFGNLAPIIQGNLGEQAMVWSKSSILQTLFPKPVEKEACQGNPAACQGTEKVVKKVVEIAKKPGVKKDGFAQLKKEIVPDVSGGDEKVEKELMKLSLTELQSLCGKYSINTKKPAAKVGMWKNRTKKELAELLKDKYSV